MFRWGKIGSNGGILQPAMTDDTGRITISVGFYSEIVFDYLEYLLQDFILAITVLSFWGLLGIEPGGDIPSYTFFDSQLFIFRWLGNQKKDCQNLDSLGS